MSSWIAIVIFVRVLNYSNEVTLCFSSASIDELAGVFGKDRAWRRCGVCAFSWEVLCSAVDLLYCL